MQAWIEAETKGADFGDRRLNRRYELLLDRLSEKPTLSIPAACRGLAETTAAYRFFDCDKTDAAKVLKPHHDATVARIRLHEVVIVPRTRPRLSSFANKNAWGDLSTMNRATDSTCIRCWP